MARRIRNSKLESRTARLKLPIRRKPYPRPALGRGVARGYRRNKTMNGAWIVKAADGHGKYWIRNVAAADDYDESDGKAVLDYFQAIDAAKLLARAGNIPADAPANVDEALTAYKEDLAARNAHPYNALRPRAHLTPTLLARSVADLTVGELKAWRDSLLDKISPATINRVCNNLCAALELAAQADPRIQNRPAWETGLAGLPG